MFAAPSFVRSPEGEIVGYHGTTLSSARSIVERKVSPDYWKASNNQHDWLGPGAYFFQDAPIRALLFAEKRSEQFTTPQSPSDPPAVIRARFKLGCCLDLLDAAAATYVRLVHKLMKRDGLSLPSQLEMKPRVDPRERIKIGPGRFRGVDPGIRHLLDREAIRKTVLILKQYENITVNSVRCAFIDGHPLYPTSWIFDLSHVQVCVREPRRCILDTPQILDTEAIVRHRNSVNENIDTMHRHFGGDVEL